MATQETPEVPLLLFFGAHHDGISRRVEGFLAQVLQRRKNHSRFSLRRIEQEARPDLHERFGITEIPTLMVVDGKRVKGRLIKPNGSKPIQEFLEPWLR